MQRTAVHHAINNQSYFREGRHRKRKEKLASRAPIHHDQCAECAASEMRRVVAASSASEYQSHTRVRRVNCARRMQRDIYGDISEIVGK
jgi:hypothetical protein